MLVRSVADGGPAARAGIKRGDLILSINNNATPSTAALNEVLANLSPGLIVPVRVDIGDGTSTTVQVTLGELPE